jgi:hypothetical protein
MKKTAIKKTVSLRPDVWDYISKYSQGNASAFIHEAQYRNQHLKKSLIEGYRTMASDRRIADDIVLWDTTLIDGLRVEDNL